MRHYASLCDSRYLPQLLVLYESLKRHSSEPFTLYVLPMDDECTKTLMEMHLPNVQMLHGFHSLPQMIEPRRNRTHQEYCWTCASNLCETLFEFYPDLPELTYLDADCMAFADPKVVFDEIGDRSIAITPHRLIPSKKYLERNGLFNVGWVTFKNTEIGRQCLSRWAAQTRERCSADYGCGDQFYLNEWPGLYGDEVCILENIGVNVGPWSIGNWTITEGPRLDGVPLVLYHYHELAAWPDGTFRLTNYELRPEDIQLIYEPYLAAYREAKNRIQELTTA